MKQGKRAKERKGEEERKKSKEKIKDERVRRRIKGKE